MNRFAAAATAALVAASVSVVVSSTPAAAQTLDERLDRIAASTTGEAYVPVSPARVFESRPGEPTVDGAFAGVGRLRAGQQVRVEVAGRAGVPLDAAGVMINPTAVFADGPGFLNLHPCADPAPLASSVNFFGGDVVGNELFVGLDAGDLCAFTSIETHLTIDVVGYAPAGSMINPLVPARLADTRDGERTIDGRFAGAGPVAAGSTTRIDVVGRGGVPAGADAVMLNLVAVRPTAPGFFAVHACDGSPTSTSSLNYRAGDVEPNEIIADINASGEICVDSLASTHLVMDVVGWVDAGSNLQQPRSARLADTRPGRATVDGVHAGDGRRAGGTTYEVQVAGRGGITDEARAAIVNVAVVRAGGPGFIVVHACLDDRPVASSMNYAEGDTLSRELVVELDDDGALCVFTRADVDLVIDGVGQFTKIPPAPTAADLSVAITDAPDPAQIGDTVTFTIDVANAGPAAATNVRVTTALPAGFTFASTSGCSEDPNGSPSCSLGTLASGASAQFTMSATVAAGATGAKETRAVVNSDAPDPDTSDNSATTTTAVDSPPTITSPADAATASVDAAENTLVILDVDSTDPDGDAEGAGLSYALTGGTDQGLFVIGADTGVMTVPVGFDFEAPIDTDPDGTYDVQVTVQDSAGNSDVIDLAITITDANDAPVITSDGGGASASVNAAENQTAVTDVSSTDQDGDTEGAGLTYSISGGADSGAFSIVTSTGVLTFDTAPDFESSTDDGGDGVYDVQVTVTDSGLLTDVQDLAVTVTDANDAPVITSNGGGASASLNVAENQTAVTDVSSTDQDGDVEGAGLTYSITGGADQTAFSIVAATGVLTFDSAPDLESPTDDGGDGTYDVQVTVTDSGLLTDVQDLAVTVTDVNETVQLTVPSGDAAFTEAGGAVAVAATLTVTDPEDAIGSATVTITNDLDGAAESLSATPSGGIVAGDISYSSVTGILSIAPGSPQSAADFQAVLRSVAYDNSSNDPDETTRSVEFSVDDSSAGAPATGSRGVTVTAVNQAPSLTGPGTFSSIGNVGISVPAGSGLLGAATITDADSTGPFTIQTTGTAATAQGGSVSIAADGSFTYTPPAGYEGTDTFTYSVCDAETPAACSSAATVSIAVSGMIWFVDDSAAAGGTGTLAAPFDAPSDFNGAATQANDDLFVYSGTYGAPFTLPNGTMMIGQGATGTSLASLLGITVPTHSNALPSIGGAAPSLTAITTGNAISLGSGNSVRGFAIGDTPGHHALSGSAVGALVVADVSVTGVGGIIEVTTSGDLSGVAFTSQSSTASPGPAAIALTGLTGGGTYAGGSPTITSSQADGVHVAGSAQAVTFTTITVTASTGDGVEIVSPSAPISLGTVNVNNSASNGRGLVVNGGTAAVSASGGVINAGISTGIEVDNATLGGSVTSVSSANGVEPGIDIDTTTGSFTVTGDGGTTANASGGTISNKSGNAIVLTNATGVTLEQLAVSSALDNGLRGTSTNNLTVTGSTFTSTGNTTGAVEAGIFLTNPTGNVTLTGLTLDASFEDHLRIDNSGTAGTIAVRNSTFRNLAGSINANDALRYHGTGSSDATIVVTGNTFQDSRGDHIQVLVEGAAGADVTIGGSSLGDANTLTASSNPNIVGSGINIAASNTYSGRLDYSIVGNDIQDAEGAAISTNLGTGSTASGVMVGTIANNIVGTVGTALSGGFGIRAIGNGSGTHTTSIVNNAVSEFDGDQAMIVNGRDGVGTVNATITSNTFVNTTNTLGFAVMSVYAGADVADAFTVCADIESNSLAGQAPTFGIADFDIFLGAGSNTINLPGYAGPTDGSVVEAFLQAQNTGAPSADVFVTPPSQVTGTGTSCPTP